MRGIKDFAIIYDISCNRERRRVDKTLKGFGFRVQKSVFECRMNRRGKEELVRKLKNLNIETGFIKIYRLEYATKNLSIGRAVPESSLDDGHAFIV